MGVSLKTLKALAFSVIALSSGIVFGHVAEGCNFALNTCPSRVAWLISCGVISFVIALPVAILAICGVSNRFVELAIALFLFAWWVAGAGVAASFRTQSQVVDELTKGFVFTALFFSLLVLVTVATTMECPSVTISKSKKDKDKDVAPTSDAPADSEAVPV